MDGIHWVCNNIRSVAGSWFKNHESYEGAINVIVAMSAVLTEDNSPALRIVVDYHVFEGVDKEAHARQLPKMPVNVSGNLIMNQEVLATTICSK